MSERTALNSNDFQMQTSLWSKLVMFLYLFIYYHSALYEGGARKGDGDGGEVVSGCITKVQEVKRVGTRD